MKDIASVMVVGLLWVALTAIASLADGTEKEVDEKGIEFRADIFSRQKGGYHTYRIPALVCTSKGTVLLFCEGRKRSRRDSGDVDMLMARSEDGGRTWSKHVVERSDGSLLMNMRAGGAGTYALGHRVTSTSDDAGMTWSKPVIDKNLPCPACQASTIRLNEDEILFLNPAVHRQGGFHLWSRRNLTLRLSKDDGRTWPCSRLIDKGLAGYSDMAITKEGKILCVFENGTGDYCEKISIVQVDPEWVRAGRHMLPEKEPDKE